MEQEEQAARSVRMRSAEEAAAARRKVLEEESRKRSELKVKCHSARRKIADMELRLGLRERRDSRHLWQWARAKVRMMLVFGNNPADGPGSGGPSSLDNCATLEEALVTLQKRRATLQQMVHEQEKKLDAMARDWSDLQPQLLAAEVQLSFDTEPYDLSQARLTDARTTLDALVGARRKEQHRLQREIDRFLQMLEEAEVDDDEEVKRIRQQRANAPKAGLKPKRMQPAADASSPFFHPATRPGSKRSFRMPGSPGSRPGSPATKSMRALLRQDHPNRPLEVSSLIALRSDLTLVLAKALTPAMLQAQKELEELWCAEQQQRIHLLTPHIPSHPSFPSLSPTSSLSPLHRFAG